MPWNVAKADPQAVNVCAEHRLRLSRGRRLFIAAVALYNARASIAVNRGGFLPSTDDRTPSIAFVHRQAECGIWLMAPRGLRDPRFWARHRSLGRAARVQLR
jgi:hypothetical protein